jgi:adenylate cyclase
MKPASVYEFAGHTLDLGQCRLLRGSKDVGLRPKSLTLLAYLIENRGRVIGKDELIAVVWPNVAVSDDSLSQCLKDVRSALGSHAEGLIRTVPRRGYVVDETRIRRLAEKSRLQQDKPSIAVLSFRPLANDREHQWFSDGLVEDITAALAKSHQLFVMPRYARTDEARVSTIEIVRGLGVDYVLEGSVRISGESVRVSAQLIETQSEGLLWADRFDRKITNIFSIQDEITGAIVKHLEIELLPEEWQAIQLSRTDDIEAYTYYRHGRQLAGHWTKSYLLLARRMFVKAVELDENFARAMAGIVLCDCYLMEWHATQETPEAILALAERALALDPILADAHVARGFALYRSGRFDEAQAAYERAMVIDHFSYEARFFSALLAWIRGQRHKARSLFVQAAEMRKEDYLAPFFVLGMMDRNDRDKERWARICFERVERAATLQPENAAPLSRGAVALVHLGDRQKAISWITRALTIDPEDLVTQYNAAAVHSLLGNQNAAIRILQNYLQRVSDDMIDVLRNDGDFDGIRSHPRYADLVARVRV